MGPIVWAMNFHYAYCIVGQGSRHARLALSYISPHEPKIYNCTSLLKEEAFKALLNNVLFQSVKTDKYGYGVIWSDEIDLSESEL